MQLKFKCPNDFLQLCHNLFSDKMARIEKPSGTLLKWLHAAVVTAHGVGLSPKPTESTKTQLQTQIHYYLTTLSS